MLQMLLSAASAALAVAAAVAVAVEAETAASAAGSRSPASICTSRCRLLLQCPDPGRGTRCCERRIKEASNLLEERFGPLRTDLGRSLAEIRSEKLHVGLRMEKQ